MVLTATKNCPLKVLSLSSMIRVFSSCVICPPLLSAVPLVLFHIHISVWQECYTFVLKPFLLLLEIWRKPPGVIDDSMAWIIAIEFSHAQNFSNESGILIPSDQSCNLTVRSYTSSRDLLYNGEDFIDQSVRHDIIFFS